MGAVLDTKRFVSRKLRLAHTAGVASVTTTFAKRLRQSIVGAARIRPDD